MDRETQPADRRSGGNGTVNREWEGNKYRRGRYITVRILKNS